MDSKSFRQNVINWYHTNGRSFPWRTSGHDPYVGLLTEVLLRKTRATQVLNVYDDFLCLLGRSSGILLSDIEATLKPLGLQRQRSMAIFSIIEDINDEQGSHSMSGDLGTLLRLPHVGPYIANATRCFYLGLPVPIVDCNIGRIFSRFFGLETTEENPVRKKTYWIIASALVSGEKPREYNWGLLDIGAGICRSVNPGCGDCPLTDGCGFAHDGDWQGLNRTDSALADSKKWFGKGINGRFAEISGLPEVPSDKRIERLRKKHSIQDVQNGAIPELDLRYLAVAEYCSACREGLSWIYSC